MSDATTSQGPLPLLDVDLQGLPGLRTRRLAGALQRELAASPPRAWTNWSRRYPRSTSTAD